VSAPGETNLSPRDYRQSQIVKKVSSWAAIVAVPALVERGTCNASPDSHEEGGAKMTGWTSDELGKIEAADELRIATVRRDGTLRDPVTIWVVRHGDDLYVRSVNGRTSSWFRGALDRHEAHIRAGGVDKDVLLVETDDINDEIDAAYRTKYRRYAASIVDTIVIPEARSATLKFVPRPTSSS
jgi:hypothetical protein